jgi:hypothetical protein
VLSAYDIIIVATFIIYFTIAPAKQPVSIGCNANVLFGWGCLLQSDLVLLAGIYVFVRGLDNMKARRLWCRLQQSLFSRQ